VKFSELKQKKWFKIIGNTYVWIFLLFIVWMIFFDTNSYFIHKELNDDIKKLEDNKELFSNETEKDKAFIKKMEDSMEMEKFAREKYYLKKDKEDIYIIEHQDSLKNSKNNE